MSKKRRAFQTPPAPPDAHNYELVKTREGPYWRKKRTGEKEDRSNEALKKNAKLTSITSPAAKRIFDKLYSYIRHLDTARFIANVSGRLKKEYNKTGKISLAALADYDLQPYHPLHKLYSRAYQIKLKKGEVIIDIPLYEESVKQLNSLVTGYYFEAVLLYGDPTKENSLRIESETSPYYPIQKDIEKGCRFSLLLPSKKTSWIVLLKLSCQEDNEPGHHPRHYGMKVVLVGEV
jgi:hypothetical protein